MNITRDVVPPHHASPRLLLAAQAQRASATRFAYRHSSYCQSQLEQASLTCPLYHHRPHSVFDRSALRTLHYSSGAPCRPAKRRWHVAKTSSDRRPTTRTSAENLQRRVGLPRSTPTTPREVRYRSSKSGTGQSQLGTPPKPFMTDREANHPRLDSAPRSMNPPKASFKSLSQKISRRSYNGPWIAIRECEPARASTITGGF